MRRPRRSSINAMHGESCRGQGNHFFLTSVQFKDQKRVWHRALPDASKPIGTFKQLVIADDKGLGSRGTTTTTKSGIIAYNTHADMGVVNLIVERRQTIKLWCQSNN